MNPPQSGRSGKQSTRLLRAAVRQALGWAILPTLASLSPALAQSQTDSGSQQSSAQATPSTGPSNMQEVVVTATRREENLSKVPISVTALTQEDLDTKGIKDIDDVARFTPGIYVDNSGTNNVSIRGIASSGGAGTTGIYIDDTPIQMRALAFNPDEAVPKSFDIDRVEVLRGPQGTLFGAGSEGGTVRYITTQPSVNQTSIYSRDELSFTQGGEPSYEVGVAAGGPLIDGVLGARVTVWYRRDGGWIDRVDPTAADPATAVIDKNANHGDTTLIRLAALWEPNSTWSVTPSIYYQNRQVHDVSDYWPIYSNGASNHYESGDPTARSTPDKFYLPALKIDGKFDAFELISDTSFYHRAEQTGYDGTLYNLGFYQTFMTPVDGVTFPLLDGSGLHLPASIANYRSPASIDNGQENFTQEIRLQSVDSPGAKFSWTTGLFFSSDRQTYLEQIHDPMLNAFTEAILGEPYTDFFTDSDGNPVAYDPSFPNDSYFLQTHSTDQQLAWYGEGTYSILDSLKLTVGARLSRMKYSFNTWTGGPQLFNADETASGSKQENSFTPKVNLSWQIDAADMVYGSYAKGYRPGGANNPVPYAACATDFENFGISGAPLTYNSDTVDSFEIGSKNNIDNRVKIAASLYYIKWHNIQQTVVPPICQISFISNLGEAAAKGGDIQADIAITDQWSADLTAGYTEARFTQDSPFLWAVNGDAISGESGQPNPPFTASAGLQYDFSLAQHKSFIRADYEYTGRPKWPSPSQDPASQQYDSANFTLPPTGFLSLRAGMQLGSWSVQPFVDNLTNARAVTNYNFSIDDSAQIPDSTRLLREYSFRPRTFGVTFEFRQ